MQEAAPAHLTLDRLDQEPGLLGGEDDGSRNGGVATPRSLVGGDGGAARLWHVELSDADRKRAVEALDEHVEGVGRGALDTPEFFDAAEIREGVLSPPARAALAALRRGSADAVFIRGLPHDRAPGETPKERNERVDAPVRGHAWLAIAVRRLGHEYAYALEKAGAIVQNIHPTREGAETQSNASWKVNLQLHTENAFHPIRPDFVLLYCVRAPADPPATRLAFVDDIVDRLTDHEAAVLREERYTIDVVESFQCEGAPAKSLPVRVLNGAGRRPGVRWHESLRPRDDGAATASHAFAEAAIASAREFRLRPGDLLAFANHRCLHGRDRFSAGLDGRDRWLLRSYALRDITRIATYVAPDRPRVMRFDLSINGAR